MQSQPRYISHYWGKANPLPSSLEPWHPLAYHGLDVAAAMGAILSTRPRSLTQISEAAKLSPSEVRQRLLIAAAFHDIGKYAENFQSKVPDLAQSLGHTHRNYASGHGAVGLGMWGKASQDLGLSVLDPWMLAATAHHGTPVAEEKQLRNAASQKTQADAAAFCQNVIDLFGRPSEDREQRVESWIWHAAGLMILADWIGSNQAWFPYTRPDKSLSEYLIHARRCANDALAKADLLEAPPTANYEVTELLPHNCTATPLQSWAALQQPSAGPQLFMIEDLTGAGKTEAALLLCHRLMRAGCAEGFYWALPTMATANGLYERLRTTYKKMFDCGSATPSLVLAHGARDLNTQFQLSISHEATYGPNQEADDTTAESSCAVFVADDRKKTFLAQAGVGTLDQALLGVLPVRHQSLRLAALGRRVLVIDEAHAYDPYMTKGIERLLTFQNALGGSAIILSATLTNEQRRRFAKCYGATPNSLTKSDFPLTTHIQDRRAVETAHKKARGTRRDLSCKRFETPQAAMDTLIEKAKEGYCGVYIRNSVREAMEAYSYMQSRWQRTDLFHARFCIGDRLEKEKTVLTRFGKKSSVPERTGQLLVATQVIEQSLDLDFDYMATDLCPMDLLIQRAGRLHRHDRPDRPSPELWIVSQDATDIASADWYAALFPAGQRVYPHTGQLWRTMRTVETANGLPLLSGSPRDLIEPVFGVDATAFPPSLDPASQKAEAIDTASTSIAHLNFLSLSDFTPQKESWAKDIFTPTRLGDTQVVVRLARWEAGSLLPWFQMGKDDHENWRLSEIAIRQQLCGETVPPDAHAKNAIDALQLSWGKKYDPLPLLALQPTAQEGVWSGKILSSKNKEITAHYSPMSGLKLV